jgi:antitoxin component YwqK of YwqJK toxin-antitoxin module
LEKKRRVIEWLQAIPGGERVTRIDENHIEVKTWWPDNKYQFDEVPHLHEMSVKWCPDDGSSHHYYTRDGEYKEWYENGQLRVHSFYKSGQIHGEYKIWQSDGQLETHGFANRGQEVRIFFNAKPRHILVDGKYYPDD